MFMVYLSLVLFIFEFAEQLVGLLLENLEFLLIGHQRLSDEGV